MGKDSIDKKSPTITDKCGTITGYQQHCDRFEYPCVECKTAKSAYNKKHQAVWYSQNGEKKRAYRRKYVLENPEKHKESCRKYRESHRQEARDKTAEYRKNNPEKVKLSKPKYQMGCNNRRRARILGNPHEPYTTQQILALYGTDCHICHEPIDLEAPRQVGTDGWRGGLHIDHVVPMSKGGWDTPSNVRPSHGWCNIKKSAS